MPPTALGTPCPPARASGAVGLQHARASTASACCRSSGPTPATQKLGFILVTGRADAALVTEGQKLGMNNLIKKPFTPQALKDCIERVVGRL